MNNGTKGFLLAFIGAACFGLAAPLAKMIYRYDVTPAFLLAVRFAIAGLLLIAVVWYNRRRVCFRLAGDQWLWLVLLSCCIFGGTLCYFTALQTLPVSLGVLILYLYPILVNIAAYFLYREPISTLQKLALLAAFSGLALMLTWNDLVPDPKGLVLAFAAAFLNCGYVLLLAHPRLKTVNTALMTSFVDLFCSVLFFCYCGITGGICFLLPGAAWVYLFLLALLPTAVGVLFWTNGVRLAGAGKASIIGVFEPLEGVLLGVLFFRESMSILQLLGAVLILSSIALLNRTGKKKMIKPLRG